ncbi:hypothetical protein [Helcococcus kunzii]|uniref:hypothetical protein n=1 Tax=Helcococcus kunzii TaxID=40091 RepID=UPI0021A72C26|nr:hypothetical protein [Helcococcus kunzii]MCT1795410.1 hypothetical protein [Helcococcus kunzii]MCT1989915.1 hypothetical protein [Helcococcus kunzii]
MKKSSIIISILRNNVFSSIIIVLQVFIILFNIIPHLNELQKNNSFINLAENTSLNNALYYMNDELIDYIDLNTGKIISSDLEIVKKKKERMKEISLQSDIVKAISTDRIGDGYYFNNITASYFIYDDVSMETAKPFLINGDIPHTTKSDEFEIALLNNKFGKKYKIGDSVLLENEHGKIKAQVVGKLSNSKTSFISTTEVSNMILPISSIFTKIRSVDDSNSIVFITDDNPLIKKIMNQDDFYKFQEQLIIYFKDDTTKEQIEKFTDKIDKEKLGFYNTTKDMIEEQKKRV